MQMPSRGRVGVIVHLLMWVIVLGWSSVHRPSRLSGQVLQPGDVATPTATYTIILVPTATATPTPGSSSVGEIGLHGTDSFSTYTVQSGDTILDVALEVGVDVQDLPCAVSPTYRLEQPLVIGDSLHVPPSGWHCHQVAEGESLVQVAARYGVDPLEIMEVGWNQLGAEALNGSALATGIYLQIPPALGEESAGGFLTFMLEQPLSVSPITAYAIGGPRQRTPAAIGPVPKDWPYGSGNFMWPVYGWMSQGYREDHRAIDIAAATGTFVTAADRGVVMRAGWNDQGYGTFVVIDHNIDFITLYAHLHDVFVKEGDIVTPGQIIGVIGSTGNSTGPHLHFEIRDFGRRANPLDYLVR